MKNEEQLLISKEKPKKKNPHEGHRKRVTDKVMRFGLGILSDHELLEYLLYSYYTRKDTNKIAHNILDEFDNNWAQLLNAGEKEIIAKAEVTENLAVFIMAMGELSKRFLMSKINPKGLIFSSPLTEEVKVYVNALFFKRMKIESLFIICIDSKNRLIASELIGEGSTTSVKIDIRKAISTALEAKATSIILTHNHPSGETNPSNSDIQMTKELYIATKAIQIRLVDHLILGHSPNEYCSFAEKGIMERIRKEVEGKK